MHPRRTPRPRPQWNRRNLRLVALESRDVPAPVMLDPNLTVRPVITGLTTPTSMAVLGNNDLLVLEKNTGKVQHVVNGQVTGTLLDLSVNFASERGLLGIALDPNFARNHAVYLYWTQPADPAPGDGTFPSVRQGPDVPALGADTDNILAVPLLGNRVDRFILNGDTLQFDRNLIRLRAFQNDGVATPPGQGDEGQPPAGNHDGGVIRFGPDGKLYIIVGDIGRRGILQNNLQGPVPDDQFGGPLPDDAHLSGVVLRLNTDGSAPRDNPFFNLGRLVSFLNPEVGANIQKVFAYGIRNSFGLTFDPFTGRLWDTENGDDSFDEVNLVSRGFNSGWVQVMGPLSRIDEFKLIETTMFAGTLQQLRWPPTLIADSPQEALARMVNPPGAQYSDPEFSWKFAVPPTAISFAGSETLTNKYRGDLILGNGAGQLMDFNLNGSRTGFRFNDSGLRDLVDDNAAKFVPVESQQLVIGQGFGIVTDIQRAPDGGLYVVSITDGAVYKVTAQATRFAARLTGAQEVPPRATPATGFLEMRLSDDGQSLRFELSVEGISNVVAAHLHLGAPGVNGPIVVGLFEAAPGGGRVRGKIASGTITASDLTGPLAGMTLADLVNEIEAGNIYVNVHTNDGVDPINTGPGDFPGGEIRGQVAVTRRVH
jgi:glucose/arabinose dehydrogenase